MRRSTEEPSGETLGIPLIWQNFVTICCMVVDATTVKAISAVGLPSISPCRDTLNLPWEACVVIDVDVEDGQAEAIVGLIVELFPAATENA